MRFWLLAILALLIQESFTTNLIMKVALDENRNIYIFTLLFILLAVLDIFVAYHIGKYIKLKQKKTKIILKAQDYIERFDLFIGKFGETVFILLMSLLLPPLFSAFLSAWLNTTFKKAFILIFIGDVFWYVMSWMIVLSIKHWINDTRLGLYLLFGITLLIIITQKIISHKLSNKR